MEKKGIIVAGNVLVDILYSLEKYPQPGELAFIGSEPKLAAGGALCNVIIDLARMDRSIPLSAVGVVGDDGYGRFIRGEMGRYQNIDVRNLKTEGSTSFTYVMHDASSKQRTFFHNKGANQRFSEDYFDWEHLNAKILHIGYILALDMLDEEDEEYGTKMARLLSHARDRGMMTSVDVVSEIGGRFQKVVPPALKYTDFCIINELEAQAVTGLLLRGERGVREENLPGALHRLKEMGVKKWCVIHAPEISCGLDCKTGSYVRLSGITLPREYIRGSVGAGDAYCAGVLYAAYKNSSLQEALDAGNAAAVASLSEENASSGVREYGVMMSDYCRLRNNS
jgi:sugar/nucleoside kinase (ribokinase family)